MKLLKHPPATQKDKRQKVYLTVDDLATDMWIEFKCLCPQSTFLENRIVMMDHAKSGDRYILSVRNSVIDAIRSNFHRKWS